jgi:hypothetical protein
MDELECKPKLSLKIKSMKIFNSAAVHQARYSGHILPGYPMGSG